MVGIENLKKAIKFGIDLGNQIEESGKDGYNWKDITSFFDELFQIPALISNGNAIKEEFKDLDAVEKQELVEYFTDLFDLDNDKAEAIIEKSLDIALDVLTLLKLLKK
jgi:hypothetical protein